MAVNSAKLIEIINLIADDINANKEFLTELDSAIGDADHGINMSKGFKAVTEKISAMADKDCGSILKTTGMTLVSTVGGASGPLYGTAFMRAGQVVGNKTELNYDDLLVILEAALAGIKMRGKAEKGEKTIVDALEPAVEVLRSSSSVDAKLFEKAVEAAKDGVEYTKGIIAKKGRASYLGERSIGHQDPGATSTYIILAAIHKALNEKSS
ncbi:MAG TPA: dihydroxyacetone kinase subunit L [Thermoanaerobacterales bacterium]|nr:dihydroxyacetone kinase subunit L [Thermoanaerobacterales bacterium]